MNHTKPLVNEGLLLGLPQSRMNPLLALELSILHWKEVNAMPVSSLEIHLGITECAMCKLFYRPVAGKAWEACKTCPLELTGNGCMRGDGERDKTPYTLAYEARQHKDQEEWLEASQNMIDILISLRGMCYGMTLRRLKGRYK